MNNFVNYNGGEIDALREEKAALLAALEASVKCLLVVYDFLPQDKVIEAATQGNPWLPDALAAIAKARGEA